MAVAELVAVKPVCSWCSLVKTELHFHRVLGRIDERALLNRHVRAVRLLFAIQHNDEALDTLHTPDGEDALIDA